MRYLFSCFLISLLSTSVWAQTLTESKLPIVIINTNQTIPDEPKIPGTMGIIYNGPGVINSVTDPLNHYDGNISIETRGNSTQDFEKKTYAFETKDQFQNDSSSALLGMGKDEDWILHAMVIDKSQLRIPLSFYLAKAMGQTASDWEFVELVLNGQYQGLYILTERIKRDDDRVDIAKMDQNDISGDAVTGGYILRIDWLEDAEGFQSNYNSLGNRKLLFQWYYPKAENIQPQQEDYIKNWMDEFEEAIFASNYTNSEGKRYTDYIDFDSFIDFFIVNEFAKNSDGYKLSTFIHKDRDSRDSRLKAGPVWDFDQTYGLSVVCSSHLTDGWLYKQAQPNCGDLESMPLWWDRMNNDPFFRFEYSCRWKELRKGLLHQDTLFNWIDDQVNYISEAIDRNFERWDFLGERIWIEPDNFPQTYDGEIEYLKDWITNRLFWLDNNLPLECLDVVTGFDEVTGEGYSIYPNPIKHYLTISGGQSEVVMYDITGKQVNSWEKSIDDLRIEVSSLHPGMYIIYVDSIQKSFKILIR